MKQKIYIVRHTESLDNSKRLFSGHRNVKLTPAGKNEAMRIADYFKDKQFSIAYTSPLSRTQDCLDLILKDHPNVQIIEDERLIERSYGWLEGYSKEWWSKYLSILFKIFHRSYYIAPPGGESLRNVKKRVLNFLNDMINTIKNKPTNVLIVAHSNSIRPLRQYFEKLSNKQMTKIETKIGQILEYTINI